MKTIAPIFAALLFATAAAGAVTETITQNYPLTPDGTIAVSNVNGSVTITSWDKNEVAIEAVKKAENAADLARIHVKFDAQPARLVIDTEYEKSGMFFRNNVRGEVQYTLRVPAGVSLKKIETVNSSITVKGVRGAVNLRTVNGGIRAGGLHASASLHTVNGGIFAAFDGLPADTRSTMETVNGGVEIELPSDAGVRIDAHSVNGGLHCDLPITIESNAHGTLRGTLGDGGATLDTRSVNGGVTIRKN